MPSESEMSLSIAAVYKTTWIKIKKEQIILELRWLKISCFLILVNVEILFICYS